MKRILTSIWFLALVVALPAILFFPPIFNKYEAELLTIETKANYYGKSYFIDLQNDGKKERVEGFKAEHNLLSFQVFDQENNLYNQYNFPCFYNQRLSNLFFYDLDDNNLTDVLGFTVLKDSLFLNYVEPFSQEPKYQSYFITTIDTKRRNILDVSVPELLFFDFDTDGDKELVFSPAVGYNWFPRKIFVFHPESGKLESSDEFGVHFSALTPFDYNSDGRMDLLCVSSSADNIDVGTDVKYSDDRPRLFVMNSDLKECIPPVEFASGIGSRLHYKMLDDLSGELLIFYHNYTSSNASAYITKMYPDGSPATKDTLFFDHKMGKRHLLYKLKENLFFIFSEKGKVYFFDNNLNIVQTLDLEYKARHYIRGQIDILEDGNPEFYTTSENRFVHIYFENFKHELQIELEEGDYTLGMIKSPIKNQVLIDAAEKLYVYEFSPNPYYFLEYPAYFLVYLFIVGFIWLIQWARIKQLKEKFELQQQVKELQFLSLKNQLDPHFIFNTFNTIASEIKQGKNDEAYDLMVRFSNLVRINLEDAGGIYTSLKKELNFVEDYLSIQLTRFKDLFEYQVNVEKNVNTEIQIPKLLLQIHVENALKHGVRPLREGGMVKINVSNEFAFVKVEIVDNGIGRKKANLLRNESTGIGLKAIKQIIELNNQNRKNKITQQINDIKNRNGEPAGTQVVLSITY